MTTVAEFTIPPEALPFGDTLHTNPDMRIEVERIVPTQESALPFFWVRGGDPELFMDHAEDEPNISETRLLERVDDNALFKAEWSPNVAIIEGFKRLDATILESEGTAEQWRFEVRAQDRGEFNKFQDVFREQEIPVELTRIFSLEELIEGERYDLTAEQRETLLRAYRGGYFEQPRQVSQAELGEEFGVSRRAVSERIRRGTRNLIATTILPSGEET